jgi:hypothetical protein
MSNEIEIKTRRIVDLLDREDLGGVLLNAQHNFSWITAGYLRGALFGFFESAEAPKITAQTLSITEINEDEKKETDTAPPETATAKGWDWRNLDNSVLPKFLTLGAIEMTIVLGLMNLLFLSFVIVQIPYLFGGMELVQTTPDFKLAEYARRGFGELVLVAALAWRVVPPFVAARARPEPATIRTAVKRGVLSLVLLDAALAAAFGGPVYAAAVLATGLVAGWLARMFAVT